MMFFTVDGAGGTSGTGTTAFFVWPKEPICPSSRP
jgi:hypothetical protein